MHPRSPARMLLPVAVALLLPLSGCAAVAEPDLDLEPRAAASRDEANELEAAREEPAEASAATPESGADAPSGDDGTVRKPSARATLRNRLLGAHELPTPAGTSGWTAAPTRNREPGTLAGTCHHFEMLTIGASKVGYREFAPADGGDARATHLVAQFADAKTAWRAFEVLKSWRDDCDKRLAKYDRHQIGDLTPVEAGGAAAHWYRLQYGPSEGGGRSEYVDAQGLALVGTRIAVLRMAVVGTGRDADRIAGAVNDAVRAAVAKLP